MDNLIIELNAFKFKEEQRKLKHNEANKRWREKNQEKIKESTKKYREENPEKILKLKRAYNEKNKEQIHNKRMEQMAARPRYICDKCSRNILISSKEKHAVLC